MGGIRFSVRLVPISVSTFREQLEAMNADALDEYYRHSAGLKPTLEIAAIYERYPDLTALEQVQAMEAEGAPVELRQYAAEGYIGNGVKLLTDQVGEYRGRALGAARRGVDPVSVRCARG